jgi:flagellar motor switch protein FliN/FliY
MSDETDSAVDQDAMADDWASAMEEQTGSAESIDVDIDSINAGVKPVELDELNDETLPLGNPKLDVILDIPVTLSMEVGSTDIAIRNLLQLSQGSVVELDRVAGEPLDVKVNGTLIAHGEVVVVNDKYGIRLTDVISPQERIKRLR